jgi:CRISPR-associated protein Csb2
VLAFGIRYLNGFAAAAEPDNLERAEWPPHPGRVFMALAAAHFQTGADPTERAALLWLEGAERGGEISAPAIVASEALQRQTVTQFVPVNPRLVDEKKARSNEKKAGKRPPPPLQSAPVIRTRQERTFPRAWLDQDTVYLQWLDLDPSESHRTALANLCAKVARIGHSSSLVQMWLAGKEEITDPNWVPDDARAIVQLRIAGPGTLDYLEQQYNEAAVEDYAALKVTEMQTTDAKLRKATKKRLREAYGNQAPPRQRPSLSLFHGYARPAQEAAERTVPGTVFNPHFLVLQLRANRGPYKQLDLSASLAVTRRWREAILSHSNGLSEPVRRMLSGHAANGGPADDPHLAFLPLAFVGHEHADGHLLGMGLALPAELPRDDRREALRAIAAVRELKLGPLGVWNAEPVTAARPPRTRRAEAWTAHPNGASHWSTVTPIVFDRHPKAKDKAQYQRETAAMIADACTRIDLPKPREVVVTPVSAHIGVPPAFAFPRLKRKDNSERRHSHAILVFEEPVVGPVLIGAGRFRGYGLCRPIELAK